MYVFLRQFAFLPIILRNTIRGVIERADMLDGDESPCPSTIEKTVTASSHLAFTIVIDGYSKINPVHLQSLLDYINSSLPFYTVKHSFDPLLHILTLQFDRNPIYSSSSSSSFSTPSLITRDSAK